MKFKLLLPGLLLGAAAQAQTLFTYGKYPVSKQEFVRAYQKNQLQGQQRTQETLRDYLDLYVNFKLKVKGARDMGLDSSDQLKFDVNNFKEQIAPNYTVDETALQKLVDEAYNRSKVTRQAAYFFIPAGKDISAADSLAAFTAMQKIQAALQSGNTDYAAIASGAATANIKPVYSELSSVTAFTVPYSYENLVFNTEIGHTAKPYRAANGWHIIKVLGEKPNPGRMKASQILIATPENATPEENEKASKLADSLYTALINNTISFSDAAKMFSNDRRTAADGGRMEEFGAGTYVSEFEQNAFNLAKDNDISKPFKTKFGYHLIQRLSMSPVPAKPEGDYFVSLKNKVMGDPRLNPEKEKFNRKALATIKPTYISKLPMARMISYADSIRANNFSLENAAIRNEFILKAGAKNYTGREWLGYAMNEYASGNRALSNRQVWDKFTEAAAAESYKRNLEKYNNEFRYQLDEFIDGNLLFEYMDKQVWSKAGQDEASLHKLYDANPSNFVWGKSADAVLFSANDKKSADEAWQMVKNGRPWQEIVNSGNGNIVADSGRFELDQLSPKLNDPKAGSLTPVEENMGSFSFTQYINTYPGGQTKSFDEARGMIANAYQVSLEENLLKALKKKYPVKINEAVFKTIKP